MRGRKLQKQLMGIGVQRNDARAFIDVYRKIKQAGRMDLIPELFPVPAPVSVRKDLNVGHFSVSRQYSNDLLEMLRFDKEQYADHVEKPLAVMLAAQLLKAGAVCIRTTYHDHFLTEIRADVKAVMPGYTPLYCPVFDN